MEPSTPPVKRELYCYDCGFRLGEAEIDEFRPTHEITDDDRGNCRRLEPADDTSIFVPLCDHCYQENTEGSVLPDDEDDTSSDSSITFYCMGCGEEIDWGITREEFEDDELHLCSHCEQEEQDATS